MEVHRCRFIEWVPSPVETIAFSRDGTNVAVGRESGDLEVWTVLPRVHQGQHVA